ncbi:DUF6221 family protein [Streptomyces albidoflavus]
MSADLITFLRSRLDEDEEVARRAAEPEAWVERRREPLPSWSVELWADPDRAAVIAGASSAFPVAVTPVGMEDGDADARAAHIARHDPARVLAEVEATRALVNDYERFVAERRRMMGGWDSYPEVSPVLAAFAAIYADHPDYRGAWRL